MDCITNATGASDIDYNYAHNLAPDSVQYLGFLAQAFQTELSQARKA